MGITVRLVTVLIGLTVAGLLVCASSYADLRDGLVAAWTFDDGTAKDVTGNGHDGEKVGNPQSVKGKFGKGFDFNGSDTGVEIADHADLQLTEPFTIACWIFPRVIEDHAGLVWKGKMIGWGSDVYNYRIAAHGTNGLTWGACTGPVEGYFHTDGVLPKMNEWYHAALVEDGTKGIAYLNGESLVATGGDANRPPTRALSAPYAPLDGHPVRIGWAMGVSGDIGSDVYFEGIIDEVFLYNRPLGEDEINELMNGALNFPVEPAGKIAATWARIKAD